MKTQKEENYKVVFSVPPDVRSIIEKEIGWSNIDGYLVAMLRNESRTNESRRNDYENMQH